MRGERTENAAEIRPRYGRGGAEGRWSRIRPRWREVESGLRDDGARQADESLDKRDDATALAPEVEHGRREGGRGDELSADVHYAGAQHERGARVDRSGRRGSGGDRIHGNLQRGLDGAAEQQADLIVMGTHSRKGMDRLFMGSVASEVIRRSEVPVLAVGPEQHHPEDGYQRLLAAVDFSPSSDAALRQARAMALEHQADVIAQHVIDDRSLPPYFQGDFIEPQRESARLAMQQLLRTLDAPPRIDPVISTGKPAQALVEAARAHAVDLIVVGDAGLSALDRFFLGSTADRLLRVATCPVLVHRGDIIGNL